MKISPTTLIKAQNLQTQRLGSATADKATASDAVESFEKVLSESIQDVNALQHEADELGAKAALGELQDVSSAMVAMEKAQLALDMTVQVRNKLVEAYREVMRMPI